MVSSRVTGTHLLAVDPGKVTGICLVSGIGGALTWTHAEASLYEAANYVTQAISWYAHDMTVAVERFTIGKRTIELGRDHSAIELTGIVRWECHRAGLPEPLFAGPSDVGVGGKGLVSNEVLRALGAWYRGGAGHANDAARHAVYWLVVEGLLRMPT